MTAVANPPNFPNSRTAWGTINGNHQMNSEEGRGGTGMFAPRKGLTRSNSSSSVSSTSSNSSATTVASNGSHANGTPLSSTTDLSQWSANGAPRKRPQPKNPWPPGKGEFQQQDMSRLPQGRGQGMMAAHGPVQAGPGQVQMTPQGMMRPMPGEQVPSGQPVLYLLSLNGTFERKTIAVPFAPETLRIGRQTNQKTVPTPTNGFFDSKVLSRQHAEIYAERNGKIYIRDVKSSNGTFVNGTRLSQENRESEPHELQTSDHLELGIDIVSEDQKTVVHHKVAAKVEHAGFMSASSNVMDMNFGDLDPANGAMMMPSGSMQMRGRTNSNASAASNGRMMPNGVGGVMNMQANGMPQQRPFFLTPVATDQILKRLANEMRNARLQAQDLGRTNQFVHTLLSKDDLKDLEKPEGLEHPKTVPMMNGIPFRADPKARFSDPPAPPPQQPLPEKPDVPSLKRGPTERPKSGPPNSPVRPDNLSQIVQLTEALNNAKRDIDAQTARMLELEEMLQKERIAREEAEELAKRLEESATVHMNGSAVPGELEPSVEATEVSEDDKTVIDDTETEAAEESTPAVDPAQETAAALQSRIDLMETQMRDMKEQMEEWKQRCETVESERDADRKTLAEMVVQLRAEEACREAAEEKARSRSRKRDADTNGVIAGSPTDSIVSKGPTGHVVEPVANDEAPDAPTLSRASTITPANSGVRGQDQRLQAALPYASMIGVVLFGMGLMAYINGWQSEPPRPEQ
ncbi:uncharacterized protein B0J16DRAFT_391573 [Fusarium flagelliforme]|uniref:Vps64 vacuolar protein sorting n=1 Tax=Fusarium flagelliforme TaxID=2675880 RepID=A0A395N5C6_9HYPO|nr:uncharacterized protein B0J16DRAFT_391573 [Fusarium flagelliforme]KAH7197860.1 hypothetical protein B0J16DRAFT_391573 [Fusarium flagelliforme]RFN55312.1 vps64 vacuolar protein sorting [Fusarium flagelliforme]